MIFVALDEAAERGELLLVDGGLCRWHRRRDGVVVIREVLVLPERRRQGIGRGLVERLAILNPGAPLLARCPIRSMANGFWTALGFRLTLASPKVNTWERRSSSTAPTAMPAMLALPSSAAGSTVPACRPEG